MEVETGGREWNCFNVCFETDFDFASSKGLIYSGQWVLAYIYIFCVSEDLESASGDFFEGEYCESQF